MKVLVCGLGSFALFDDISGIGKDLEGESAGPGDKNYSPLIASRQYPTPKIDAPWALKLAGNDFGNVSKTTRCSYDSKCTCIWVYL